jgi:hypothetical protein
MRRIARSNTPPTIDPAAHVAVDADVRITAATDDGQVILHTRTARLWVLNRSATEMWERLSTGQPIDRVAHELSDRYDRSLVEIREDVVGFARALAAAGLVRIERAAS